MTAAIRNNWLVLFLSTAALASTAILADKSSEFVKGKICIGTNGRMSVPSNREHHYRNLRDRYTNCTYVDGNLELTWLKDENQDLSFLQYIREVTGYVLISHVDVPRIVLPRLQIIRGRTLFKLNIYDKDFALLVTLSKMNNLEMPALRDILGGSVGLFNNYNLCHIKTINWDEIITGPEAKYVYVYNFTLPERSCSPCHNSCKQGCWGEGPENCQRFSKINCSPQCWQGRCFGPNPRECCHLFCAGGCTGPKQSDCLACRNFYDDGVCTQECPAMQRYNPTTYSWEANPQGKYAYGATCVKKCPEHLLKDNGACVRSCPPKKKAENGECVPCDGPCPKTCDGVNEIHSGNIDSFRDCTIIEGSLTILDQSFRGFQQVYNNFSFGPRYQQMHPDRLEVFSTLKEVTGYVNIQGDHPDFTNLSYFRNLEIIGGRSLTEYFASLYIVKTSLTSLGLRSLKKIHSGSVAILENKELCFAQGISWDKIKKSREHETLLQNNKPLNDCDRAGLMCDAECSEDGCWGPGPDQCLSCAHFRLGTRCLPDCDTVSGMYKSAPNMCMLCHEECNSTCHGPGPGNCTDCKHVKDGPFCTPVCPTSKYDAAGECRPCHENCVDGCKGPENTIGPDGCNSCERAIINGDVNVVNTYEGLGGCYDQFTLQVIPSESPELAHKKDNFEIIEAPESEEKVDPDVESPEKKNSELPEPSDSQEEMGLNLENPEVAHKDKNSELAGPPNIQEQMGSTVQNSEVSHKENNSEYLDPPKSPVQASIMRNSEIASGKENIEFTQPLVNKTESVNGLIQEQVGSTVGNPEVAHKEKNSELPDLPKSPAQMPSNSEIAPEKEDTEITQPLVNQTEPVNRIDYSLNTVNTTEVAKKLCAIDEKPKDRFDHLCYNIASQLRSLPVVEALKLQLEIQQLISNRLIQIMTSQLEPRRAHGNKP